MPVINIRWSDNTADLTKNLKEGANQIEATRASAEKMVQSLSGDKLIAAAHKYTAAVQQIGGAEKLSATEKERINSLLTKAIEKYTALGQVAPTAMQQLANATKATANGWQDFVTRFNVQSAISDPLGTARQAVLAFSGSFSTMGIAATAAVSAMGAVGAAAYQLVTTVAAAGAKLDDLRDTTDISVPVLSRWSNAAKVMGGDITQLTNAVFKMQTGMAESSESFAKGLTRIGLTMKDLKGLNPDEQFEAIARGLNSMTNRADANAAGMAIFGRQYRELAPIVRDFGMALEHVNDLDVWTAQQAADAEKFEMELRALKLEGMELATELGQALMPAARLFVDLLSDGIPLLGKWAGAMTGLTPLLRGAGAAWDYAAAGVALFNKSAGDLPEIIDSAATRQAKLNQEAERTGIAIPTMDDAMANWRKTTEQATETSRRAAQVISDERRETERLMEAKKRLDEQYRALAFNMRDAIFLQDDLNRAIKQTAVGAAPLLYAKALPMTQIALADVGQEAQVTIEHTRNLGTVIKDFFTNIPKSLGSIQESLTGTLSKLFGANPDSIMASIISGGLNFVFGPIGGILSSLVAKGLAHAADLAWAGLKKIGGFFKSIFGGLFGGGDSVPDLTPEGAAEFRDNYLASIGTGFEGAPVETATADFGATGGLITKSGIQHFATGGFVRPTLQRTIYQPRGADTVPIMAAPNEMILNQPQQSVIADVIKGALKFSDQSDAIVMELRALRADVASLQRATVIQMDGREIARGLNRVLDNGGVVRTEMRETLGVV